MGSRDRTERTPIEVRMFPRQYDVISIDSTYEFKQLPGCPSVEWLAFPSILDLA
jgi:hypothetical protein